MNRIGAMVSGCFAVPIGNYPYEEKEFCPASIRQRDSGVPNCSMVSDVDIFIKPNMSHNPSPPLQLLETAALKSTFDGEFPLTQVLAGYQRPRFSAAA